MRTSIYRESRSVMALPAGARTNGTFNGTTVDRVGAGDPSLLFVVTSGTVTDGTHTFTVQESDDGTAFTTAPAGAVQGTGPVVPWSTGSNAVFEVGYFGAKRFVRLTVTTTGATTGGVFSATATLYGMRYSKDR